MWGLHVYDAFTLSIHIYMLYVFLRLCIYIPNVFICIHACVYVNILLSVCIEDVHTCACHSEHRCLQNASPVDWR